MAWCQPGREVLLPYDMMTTQDHLSKRLPCYPATTRIEQDECHPPERYRLGVQGIEPLYAQSVTSPDVDSMASVRVHKRPHRRHSAQGIAASLNEILYLVWLSLVGDLVDERVHLVRERVLGSLDVVLYFPHMGSSRVLGDSNVPMAKGTRNTAAYTSIAHTCDFHAEISS